LPDIFDEIQEDLRAERAQRLWKRYGGLFAGVALVALIGVGGWQGWRWHQNRQAQAAATDFLATHQATEAQGADLRAMAERFSLIARDAPVGYRTLARLRAAALQAETGQRAEALATWDALAGDTAADPLYRDLAGLMWVLHAMDSADPAQLAARVAPLARADGPWRASAQELQALIQLRRGEKDAARAGLKALAEDVTAPQGIRERAGRVASGIGS
jgi:hypothetical protein